MFWSIWSLVSVAHAAPSGDALFTGAGKDAVVIRGYTEVRGTYNDTAVAPWTLTERLRPTMKIYLWDRVSLTTTAEARLDQGRYDTGVFVEAFRTSIESSLRDLAGNGPSLEEVIDTCEWDVSLNREIDTVSDVLALERLYLDFTLPAADLRIGRQPINWGSALFLNPSDIFQQVLLAEPWQERAGIDAVRVNVPVGEDGSITALVGALDTNPSNTSPAGTMIGFDLQGYDTIRGALKGSMNVEQTDISALVSTDGSLHYAGLDFRGDLRGPVPLGWWMEGVYRVNTSEEEVTAAPRVAIGADYSFQVLNRLYVAAQVFHDGTGEIPALYDWNSRQDPALEGITPCEKYDDLPSFTAPDEYRLTLGKWYGLNILRLEVTEDLQFTNTMVMNLADQTGLLFPATAYTIGSRVTVNGGVQYLFGSDGEFRPPSYQMQVGEVNLEPLQPTLTGLAWVRVNL